jgi:hypothetical protein
MLGDDENQIGAHSAFRTLHSALERLFSGIHFGMDDGDNWRLDFCRAKGAKAAKSVGLASL